MRAEPHEEDQSISIVLQSGITSCADKGKQLEEDGWVRQAVEKDVYFDLNRAKETFIEAKKNFAEASTSGGKDKLDQEMDPSMLTTFLETCMKLLRDSNAVKGLQELINRCTKNTLAELRVV